MTSCPQHFLVSIGYHVSTFHGFANLSHPCQRLSIWMGCCIVHWLAFSSVKVSQRSLQRRDLPCWTAMAPHAPNLCARKTVQEGVKSSAKSCSAKGFEFFPGSLHMGLLIGESSVGTKRGTFLCSHCPVSSSSCQHCFYRSNLSSILRHLSQSKTDSF